VFLLIIWQVENQKVVLEFWKTSLNPLTWTEILRQVLVAAGFGSKQGAMRREALSKVFKLLTLGIASDFTKLHVLAYVSDKMRISAKIYIFLSN
jgi:hypothetical protein